MRIVLGPRANGDKGLFISPVGVDADTAADSALLLNASSKVSQLLLMGRITSTQTITLGLGRSPLVFITSEFNWSGITGHTAGPGPFRPSSPPGGATSASTCTVNSNGVSITITLTLPTTFQVYSQAFT